MDIPPGMKENKDECLTLRKTFYGLVKRARQFYVKVALVLFLWRKNILPACKLGTSIQDTILFVSKLRIG